MGNEKLAVRQFNKSVGTCPECGWKGAAELVEDETQTVGFLPWWTIPFTWPVLVYEFASKKKIYKRTLNAGGIKKLCGSCNTIFS